MPATKPLPFVTGKAAFDEGFTNKAKSLQQSGGLSARLVTEFGETTARVSGSCPRCGDDFDYRLTLEGPVAKTGKVDPRVVLVKCTCIETHPKRPSSQGAGCGARFNVRALVV